MYMARGPRPEEVHMAFQFSTQDCIMMSPVCRREAGKKGIGQWAVGTWRRESHHERHACKYAMPCHAMPCFIGRLTQIFDSCQASSPCQAVKLSSMRAECGSILWHGPAVVCTCYECSCERRCKFMHHTTNHHHALALSYSKQAGRVCRPMRR